MSIRSPKGFVQLGTSRPDMDNDIPLTQVRSNASSTGARKPNQGTATGFSMELKNTNDNEKHGFFHRGRRQAKKDNAPGENENLTSDEASLNAMGKLYNKIIGASVVTRYLVYIVPVAILLAVPLIVISTFSSLGYILHTAHFRRFHPNVSLS